MKAFRLLSPPPTAIRTYWCPAGEGRLEFLGAFPPGHVADANTPQGSAHIIDVPGLTIAEMLRRLAGRVYLVNLPLETARWLAPRVPATVPWKQLEGFVK